MKFIENGFSKLFLFYEKFKKNAVGLAVSLMQLSGGSRRGSKGLSVKTAAFCLPERLQV
jgi:hypothetical protein